MSYTFALQDAFYDGMQEGELKGKLKGKLEGKLERELDIARSLLDILDDSTISKKIGLPLEKVQELRREALSMA